MKGGEGCEFGPEAAALNACAAEQSTVLKGTKHMMPMKMSRDLRCRPRLAKTMLRR